jgi:hypothetical protein
MKFLVDAHLPKRLAAQLSATGHDAIHTLDLPLKFVRLMLLSTKFPWLNNALLLQKTLTFVIPI